MERSLREVLEYENHIELLQAKLDTLERGDLDLRQRDDQEWRVREVHKALGSRLKADVLTDGHTLERQLAEGNIDFKRVSRLEWPLHELCQLLAEGKHLRMQ